VVNPAALRLYRLVLRAYPAGFRRDYGSAMEQLLLDQCRADPPAVGRVVLREILDAVLTAPRLRWEIPMNRIVLVAIAVTVAIASLLAAGALALIPIGATAVAAWFLWGRSLQPIGPAGSSRRWRAWLVAGLVSIGIGVAIPQVDGGELSAVWWTVMAVAVVGGIGMTVAGILLALSDRGHRLTPIPHP
jgi:hypothetical protein